MTTCAYESYSQTGVVWLDVAPTHWSSVPIKYVSLGPESLFLDGDWIESKDLSDDGVRYLTTGNIGEGQFKEQGTGFISSAKFTELKCTEVFPGDILVSRLNRPIGRACIVPELDSRIVTSVDNVIVRADRKYSRPFLVYLFSCKDYFRHTDNLARGATMQRISRGLLGNIRIVVPPIVEQTQIAKFLDYETARIDALIEKQQQLIALLKEKRQAVISHAVTKGLNPDAPMRDSGVEWLGEVPAHWTVSKLKWKAGTTSGGTPSTSRYEVYYEGGNIPWIRTTDLNNGILTETPIAITPQAVRDTACSVIPKNSVLIAMYGGAGSIGKHALLTFESTINQAVAGILPSKSFDSRYLHSFYEFFRPFWMIGAAGTRKDPNIGQDHIKESQLPCPPFEEQIAIGVYLDRARSQFEVLSQRADELVELLQERRTALISAAVTGKIDVRDWLPPESSAEAA